MYPKQRTQFHPKKPQWLGVILLFSLLLSNQCLKAQLSADFSLTPSEGCAPVTVQFTDQSSGNIKSYLWDLGNGNNSTKQNPSAIYYASGKYTIKLVITDVNGDKDSITKTEAVTVFKAPTASLKADKTIVCTNETVTFSDQSSEGDGTINYWKWDLGDGTLRNTKNTNHDYTTGSKKHTISLVVRDDNGCESTVNLKDYIEIRKVPDADFTMDNPAGCAVPHVVNFEATSPGSKYEWDFDNGQTDNGKKVKGTFNAKKTYNVKLTLTDAFGCKNTSTDKVEIVDFKADFTVLKWTECLGKSLQFLDNSTPKVPGMTFKWEFGDGGTDDGNFASHEFYQVR